jgi:hypothetical protein
LVSKTTLNAKNLEALGAGRLAELLLEICAGSAAAKRRLRLELAGAASPRELAKEVRKRLTTIARSRSFVDWQNRQALVSDLETQRHAIIEQVANADPVEALDLSWRFLKLANSIFERCDDSSGVVIGVFQNACEDLAEIAKAAKTDPRQLADHAFQALTENDYGQYDRLIAVLAPALGPEGLEHLKQRMTLLSSQPVRKPAEDERQVIGWGSGGPIYSDEIANRSRASTARLALQEIADAQGDVDAFIGQYDEAARKVPKIAAGIAQRLLMAGRAEEAWQAIEATEFSRSGWPEFEWENARIDVLDAIGRSDEAQTCRWSCFERWLSTSHLRAYLKRLPDFDDVEAEERALSHAQEHKSLLQALSFLVSWPALDRAASLVIRRAAELDGDHYEILTPAANTLAGKHPLAATLGLRSMINFSLGRSRSSRYQHVARHLMECASLALAIRDFGSFETHEAYATRLRGEHGRKSSFWKLVSCC